MLEIRGHARGGQGMVTAFEILAKIFSRLGDFQVQAFPAFGVERTGAPIQAFLRVAKKEILNRSNIYHPHLIVVFDESLLEQVPVFDGLKEKGAMLLNTEKDISAYKEKCATIYTVPATQISLDLGLGSKSLPIVNAAMIGAIMRVFEADLNIANKIIKTNVPAKPEANAKSALIASEQIRGLNERNQFLFQALHSELIEEEDILKLLSLNGNEKKPQALIDPYWTVPMSKNKTGNWRLLTPSYETKAPPCNSNCPAGTDVRKFIRLASEKQFEQAYDVIYQHNPFPGICGRVCPHFCEQNCNRNALDEGLNIGAIERYLGDRMLKSEVKECKLKYVEKIAVIGSGPAGLTAALRLREKGYEVTVFEALPHAGGMMRAGIPKFRLPDDILNLEIERIEKKGVRIILNKKIKVTELSDDFSAVITAVGAHVGSAIHIEDDQFVTQGIDFLRQFKLHREYDNIEKGDKIAIIGGGNTAVDVARTVLRLGAEPTIYYRRTIHEMPAIAQEVEEALAEGVEIKFLTAPVSVNRHGRKEKVLTLIEMKLGEPDASGRRRPIPIKGSEKTIIVEKIISAIGQRFDPFAFDDQKIKPQQGRIEYESNTPIFCAGDMAWGGTVTEAIGSGNKVAEEVHAFLKGLHYDHKKTMPEVVLPENINFTYYLPSSRHEGKMHHPKDFYLDFAEVKKGLDTLDIVEETARCLHCGDCFSCGNCYNYCPDAAIHIDEQGRVRINYDYCKGCGICVQECPCSAMRFQLVEAEKEKL